MDEKRRHPRASGAFVVTYRLKEPFEVALRLGDKDHNGIAHDISEAGLGFEMDHEIPVGARVELRFSILNDRSGLEKNRRVFHLFAQCRHCKATPDRSYRVGVLFANAAEADRTFIGDYIRAYGLRPL